MTTEEAVATVEQYVRTLKSYAPLPGVGLGRYPNPYDFQTKEIKDALELLAKVDPGGQIKIAIDSEPHDQ